jgi:hypothetical protein
VVSSANLEDVKTYPVHALKEEEIVDTNAAGDAFAGGFMAGLVAGKTLDESVAAGQKLAAICVQQVRFDLHHVLIASDKRVVGWSSIPVAKGPDPQLKRERRLAADV